MKKAAPILITILLITAAGYGVYLIANSGKSDTGDTTSTTTDPSETSDDDSSTTPSTDETTDDPTDTDEADDEDDDETSTSDEIEYEMAGEGETAFTLSELTATPDETEEGKYDVSVKVTIAGETESYEQGYTYRWYISNSEVFSNTRESPAEGDKTHSSTLGTTRDNPTIKFMVEDPYTGKFVSIEAPLQDLLGIVDGG